MDRIIVVGGSREGPKAQMWNALNQSTSRVYPTELCPQSDKEWRLRTSSSKREVGSGKNRMSLSTNSSVIDVPSSSLLYTSTSTPARALGGGWMKDGGWEKEENCLSKKPSSWFDQTEELVVPFDVERAFANLQCFVNIGTHAGIIPEQFAVVLLHFDSALSGARIRDLWGSTTSHHLS
ncbi:hypothetical protein C8Q75DRAFT_731309 [Abortiporus biennis]|nr:hypothetical protein C8Q75DRAFT_731309 [Abortiporus biennis]